MHDMYISVLLVSLCLRVPEPEFCDYAFFVSVDRPPTTRWHGDMDAYCVER
jgi:hypothetical protein